jgi:hypothetical protein
MACAKRRSATPRGNDRKADAVGVDANYQTEIVVNWCKIRLDCIPLRGEDGWKQPIWTNKPTRREYSERGKARRKGPKTFPVGTWQAKSRHFGALEVKKADDLCVPNIRFDSIDGEDHRGSVAMR